MKNISAVSGVDGRFRFTVPRRRLEAMRSDFPWGGGGTYVVVAAEGYGFAVASTEDGGDPDITLRLVRDDLPLRGRILNLEGRPVAGVRVQLAGTVYLPAGRTLDAWLAVLRRGRPMLVSFSGGDSVLTEGDHLLSLYSPAFSRVFPPVTTGPDGRFQFRGIGRERAVDLRIEGPTIATRIVRVAMRTGGGLRLPFEKEDAWESPSLFYPATFDHVAVPTRPVIGVVRDRDTGKPLAGIAVRSNLIRGYPDSQLLQTVTDQQGRYQLLGLPKGGRHQLAALASDLPYLAGVGDVPDLPGLGPVTVDFALQRGTWVRGRVTDRATGEPVRGHVDYHCFRNNPWARVISAFPNIVWDDGCWTKADGSYRVAALPGPGLVTVEGPWGRYRKGVGAEAIKGSRDGNSFRTVPLGSPFNLYNALAAVSPRVGEESIQRDLSLDPGRLVIGTVLDADGKPLAGVRVAGLHDDSNWDLDPLATAFFQVWIVPKDKTVFPRNQTRCLQFIHRGKRLAGSVVVSDDTRDTITVKLVPWGTVRGRVIGADGLPCSRAELTLHSAGERHPTTFNGCHPIRILRTDENGAFAAEGLVPGLFYEMEVLNNGSVVGHLFEGLMIPPAESKDLGDVRLKQSEP